MTNLPRLYGERYNRPITANRHRQHTTNTKIKKSEKKNRKIQKRGGFFREEISWALGRTVQAGEEWKGAEGSGGAR